MQAKHVTRGTALEATLGSTLASPPPGAVCSPAGALTANPGRVSYGEKTAVQ